MFKKENRDLAVFYSKDECYRVPASGYTFEREGREFFVGKNETGKWHVSDLGTGYGLYAYGSTRQAAVDLFDRVYLRKTIEFMGLDDYAALKRAFDSMPYHPQYNELCEKLPHKF